MCRGKVYFPLSFILFVTSTLRELLADFVLVIVLIGLFASLVVGVAAVLYPVTGIWVAFSEGYSMCPASMSYVDYTSISDAYCSFAPGDIVVAVRWLPPEVNTVACGVTTEGVICHKVYKVTDTEFCFVGTHPKAEDFQLCLPYSSYVGRYVMKIPRAFGLPGIAMVVFRDSIMQFIALINSGHYPG